MTGRSMLSSTRTIKQGISCSRPFLLAAVAFILATLADHLLDLCHRFDLRFTIVQDRFEPERFNKRSIEDLKRDTTV